MGHPSTSTRRVAASTPHLPLPTPSTPPAVVPVAPRVASPHSPTPSAPATPSRRARSPTASTSASRARSTSVTATRTSSPLTPHGVSPVTPRATSPATRRPPPLLGTGVGSASTSHLPLSSPGGSGLPPASPRLVPRRSSHGHSSSVPIVLRTKSPSPSPDASRTPSHPLGHRVHSSSTSSLPGPSPSAPQRELIRSAASVLVKEMVNRRSSFRLSAEALDEVESRMRVLARMERIWGRSGVGASSVGGGLGGSEDREKNAFVDALQDGYVLCQFLNKLRPGSIPRVDPSSGKGACDANISKFLVAATSYGVLSDELFDPSDFALASSQSIGRVAQTIIAIARIADSPPPRKFVSKSPSSIAVTSSVYTGPTVSSASTPNLLVARSTSPSSPKQKRWSPPAPGLPTVRSASPSESEKLRERERKSQEEEEGDVFGPMEGVTSQQRVGARASTTSRTSVASSSQTSDTTNAYSSLLDYRLSTRYGTIRTMTTEATSLGTDAPSLTRTEASSAAASVAAAAAAGDKDLPMRTRSKRSSLPGTPAPSNPLDESPRRRDRKVSDGLGVVDLSRVAEETDEGSVARRLPPNSPSSNKPPPIRLGKGKWPDDFMNAFESARPNPAEVLEGNGGGRRSLDSPTSPSKHRMARTSNSVDLSLSLETIEPISPLALPRRRSSRNNTDALLPREVSPSPSRDSLTPSPVSGGVRQPVLRRSTTRAYVPRATCEERSAPDASVPFPKAEGSTLAALPSSSETLHGESYTESPADSTKPLYQRTRHRSEMDKERRSSFGDQTGQKPTGRSRYESMVNLGGNNDFPKGETSLIGGMDGSAVRKPLVVKEEGKAPTHYQLGNCIGRGQFGSVYRALNLNTGQMVAVKRIRLEGLSESEVAQLMHEVELVKRLSHPSIVKYEGMARDSDTLNIVLEYAENGSLAQTLKAFGKLNEALVATYVTKVLEGLHYLHTSQVVHCDLKAANILTTKTGNVKLSDFGVSLNLRAMEQIKNDVAGTPNWMAPEVIELKGASPASDIWSLACTIIELLTGRPPYADVQNGMSVMFRIVEDPMPPIPEGLSGPLQDFLKLCFNKDPVQRPNAEVLFEHPWLKKEWGIYKELRPQDSIPFLRRVSADLQRPGIRRFSFLEEDVISPRASNGSTQPEFTPHPHTFVKSTFSQPVTCRVCNHPIKKNAVFCTECSLIAHSKCATEAPQTCDLRAQVIRLSLDLQREAVRQQSPSPHPASPISVFSNSPPKLSDSPLSSSPDRFKMFVRKKSKASGVGSDPADPPKATTPPVAFKYDDTNPTKRMLLPRLRNNEDNSHSRASIASSHQSSSMRSAVTATGSLSSGGVAEAGERVRPTSDLRHRTSRLTASSLVGEMMMSAEAGEEAYLKRKGTRRGKRDSDTSKNGCVVQ
ncbi:hypothetical protein K439DRAFT_1530932 [Ramaria rubella]|nr:hypothetical protein K439DRAFT_1530932 [Ramaria rubella]